MQALVVIKKTNKKILNEKLITLNIKDPSFIEKLEQSHKEQTKGLDSLRTVLTQAGLNFQEVTRDDIWPNLENFDLIITLGGDGTILSSSRFLENKKIPVLGIRSSDESVGYLCCLDHSHIKTRLPALLKNIEKQTISLERLYGEITTQKNKQVITTKPILNDFLYTHKFPSFTTRYAIALNGRIEEHKSSGIWFATPTGSTAAIGAAGGKKQKMNEKVFQYKTRELYSPKPGLYQLSGGFYDPDCDELVITNYSAEAILAADGQHGSLYLGLGDKITFKRALPFCLVSSKEK